MADKFRYKYGDTKPVVAAVDSATVIEIGDLLWQDTDDAKPASDQADQGSEEANQDEFHDNFLGVAAQRSRAGDTDNIRVDTAGVFDYVCRSSTYELGDLIGASEAASGIVLEDQQVESTAQAGRSIGRVRRREAAAVTTVRIEIVSTIIHGGVQAGLPST
jgi:hypothetical protein